jgi:hypothetical protein
MDIEQFYSADERRRQSAEIEFGNDWYDVKENRYELSWVEDTGELYAMLEVTPKTDSWTPFGDQEVESLPVDSLVVIVLGTIATREEVEQLLDGWAGHMAEPDGVHWVAERLKAAGVARPTLD